jgi:hypothetical protein
LLLVAGDDLFLASEAKGEISSLRSLEEIARDEQTQSAVSSTFPIFLRPWQDGVGETIGERHHLITYDSSLPLRPQFSGVQVVVDFGGSRCVTVMAGCGRLCPTLARLRKRDRSFQSRIVSIEEHPGGELSREKYCYSAGGNCPYICAPALQELA